MAARTLGAQVLAQCRRGEVAEVFLVVFAGFLEVAVNLFGRGLLAGGGEFLSQHQARLGCLDPLPALSAGCLDQDIDAAFVAEVRQRPADSQSHIAVAVVGGLLYRGEGFGVAQQAEVLDDRRR